jgi:hypothetical protein
MPEDLTSPALLPLRRKMCNGFLSPLKSIDLTKFEPANIGSNGKHANHYTTEATKCKWNCYIYRLHTFPEFLYV